MNMKYKLVYSFLFFLTLSAASKANEPIIELETNKSTIDIENESISATGGVILKYEDITIRSDSLKKIEGKNILFSYGNVLFNQGNQIVKAEQVIFDMDTNQAKIIGSESYDNGVKLRFGGEETLSEYPNKITIKNGWFTTSPYEKPNYRINAEEIEIYPNRKIVAKNIGLNVKGKTWFKFPYYVASLRPVNRRATLFPFFGSDSDRGLYAILGFDYDKGPLAQGFVDFELSSKKKLALKFANDYTFGESNKGSVVVNRFVVPITNSTRKVNEWDFSIEHNAINTPKKEKIDRKFYDLGYGIWNLNYRNMTTNLINAVNGKELRDDYTSYVNTYKKIGFYDFKINQELGRSGELNFDYFWTQDRSALKALTEINDKIVEDDDLDPRKTDVELYRRLKYTNGNSDILINIENEDFLDVNPGYIGDINSYRKKENYSIDFKGPKIRLEYLNSDKDEYGELFGLKERDESDSSIFESKNYRWVQKIAYDKRKEIGLSFGNYYPFMKREFLGYEPKTLIENLTNNFYFGTTSKYVEISKKEYGYDFTRDNDSYNSFFLNSMATGESTGHYNEDRIYKTYGKTNTDIGSVYAARKTKKIIYEQYDSKNVSIGNDKIYLPIKDSYLTFNYNFEHRNYKETYVPSFKNGRKQEDVFSKTGYKIETDSNGNALNQSPVVKIHTLDTKLYTTIFDNTSRINNKYDIKVTNEADVTIQRTEAESAMALDSTNNKMYDIIETPTNSLGLKNDFNFHLGNVNLNYKIIARDDKHFKDNWLKNRYVRNYVKADIENKRFISADFQSNETYEFEDYRDEKNMTKEFQYGYVTNSEDQFLYKITDKTNEYFPYNTSYGWNRDTYKEKERERTISASFNEWGIEYTNLKDTINDIFDTDSNGLPSGTPELKSKSSYHKLGFVYDTSKMKNKKFESDHYFKATLGTGKKTYRYLNGTSNNGLDDTYGKGKDYITLGMLYRYENNAKPKYEKPNNKNGTKINIYDNNLENFELTKNSNTQDFSIENESSRTKNIFNSVKNTNETLLSTEKESYGSYVDEELNKQNRFDLNDYLSKTQSSKKDKKYFQIGFDMELDGTDSLHSTELKGMDRINDLIFKVEGGHTEKLFLSYKYIMERPDRIYRNASYRKSLYNYRRHDFEAKYAFGKDPDQPWWVGAKVQYVQNGSPKSSDPEIYESSSLAEKVNKITLGLVTLSHRFENIEWELGAGAKWDKPDNKKLGYYPVVVLKFSLTPFPEKSVKMGYDEGAPTFGVGF